MEQAVNWLDARQYYRHAPSTSANGFTDFFFLLSWKDEAAKRVKDFLKDKKRPSHSYLLPPLASRDSRYNRVIKETHQYISMWVYRSKDSPAAHMSQVHVSTIDWQWHGRNLHHDGSRPMALPALLMLANTIRQIGEDNVCVSAGQLLQCYRRGRMQFPRTSLKNNTWLLEDFVTPEMVTAYKGGGFFQQFSILAFLSSKYLISIEDISIYHDILMQGVPNNSPSLCIPKSESYEGESFFLAQNQSVPDHLWRVSEDNCYRLKATIFAYPAVDGLDNPMTIRLSMVQDVFKPGSGLCGRSRIDRFYKGHLLHVTIESTLPDMTHRLHEDVPDMDEGQLRLWLASSIVSLFDDPIDGFNPQLAAVKFTQLEFQQRQVLGNLAGGVKVAGHNFRPFACSSSQANTFKFTFCRDVDTVRKWAITELSDLETKPVKLAMRLGLLKSPTIPTINLKCDPVVEDDAVSSAKENGDLLPYSDGCGWIGSDCASAVWCKLKIFIVPGYEKPFFSHGSDASIYLRCRSYDDLTSMCRLRQEACPSSFQIRCQGFKGMLMVRSDEGWQKTDDCVSFRKSMKKFSTPDTGDHSSIEVLDFSCPSSPVKTNFYIIAILHHAVNSTENFKKLLMDWAEKDIKFITAALDDDDDDGLRKQMLNAGDVLGFNYLSMGAPRKFCLLGYAMTAVIPFAYSIPQSGLYFGVCDYTKIITKGQIFLQTTDPETNERRIHLGKVLLMKEPIMQWSDYLLVTAVDNQRLHHLVDVVVFSEKGPKDEPPDPHEMAGSDLDGDKFIAIWNPEMLKLIVQHNPEHSDLVAKPRSEGGDSENFTNDSPQEQQECGEDPHSSRHSNDDENDGDDDDDEDVGGAAMKQVLHPLSANGKQIIPFAELEDYHLSAVMSYLETFDGSLVETVDFLGSLCHKAVDAPKSGAWVTVNEHIKNVSAGLRLNRCRFDWRVSTHLLHDRAANGWLSSSIGQCLQLLLSEKNVLDSLGPLSLADEHICIRTWAQVHNQESASGSLEPEKAPTAVNVFCKLDKITEQPLFRQIAIFDVHQPLFLCDFLRENDDDCEDEEQTGLHIVFLKCNARDLPPEDVDSIIKKCNCGVVMLSQDKEPPNDTNIEQLKCASILCDAEMRQAQVILCRELTRNLGIRQENTSVFLDSVACLERPIDGSAAENYYNYSRDLAETAISLAVNERNWSSGHGNYYSAINGEMKKFFSRVRDEFSRMNQEI